LFDGKSIDELTKEFYNILSNYIYLEKYPELETYLSTKIIQLIKENERKISVTEEHLKKFEMTMKAKGKSERILKDQLNYLRRMFKEFNWELSRGKIIEYMNRVMEESPFVAKHNR
jgi:ribosomal 50S subunit-associated protein YjgA (DUF615 family)